MTDVTRILERIESGESGASAELLPLVYDELRQLAAARLSHERPGQSLQPTALVHEAYLRLLGGHETEPRWDNRGHFFAAAAEAMRRILIDRARRVARPRHGGHLERLDIDSLDLAVDAAPDQFLALNEALERLEREDPAAFALVRLRYFAGLSIDQAAAALNIAPATAYRYWNFARAWLYAELLGE